MTAAQNYPCSYGRQEVDFVVCTNKELLQNLSDQLHHNIPEFEHYLDNRIAELHVKQTIWCDATCVVFLVSNKTKNFHADSKEMNMGEAGMSVIAAAEALGYNTLPVLMPANPAASEFTAKALNIPKEDLGLSIALGKALPEWKDHLQEKEIKSNVKYIE